MENNYRQGFIDACMNAGLEKSAAIKLYKEAFSKEIQTLARTGIFKRFGNMFSAAGRAKNQAISNAKNIMKQRNTAAQNMRYYRGVEQRTQPLMQSGAASPEVRQQYAHARNMLSGERQYQQYQHGVRTLNAARQQAAAAQGAAQGAVQGAAQGAAQGASGAANTATSWGRRALPYAAIGGGAYMIGNSKGRNDAEEEGW